MISKEMYIFKNYKTMIWKMYIQLNCRNFPTIWKERMVWISFKQIDTKCGLNQIVGKFLRF